MGFSFCTRRTQDAMSATFACIGHRFFLSHFQLCLERVQCLNAFMANDFEEEVKSIPRSRMAALP